MSLEEVEAPFFVRSLADLSRHFFAATPKPQGRYAFPAASFWNSLTAESTAHWAQWHCNQAHIANHFAFRFQGPAHSMILGSCCIEKIEQCGIRVEPHQKSAYSEMNWTELNNLVQSMNGKDHLICTWRTTFLPPGSSCRSLETFALQPWLQTMDQPQKKTRETATVSCTILLPVWGGWVSYSLSCFICFVFAPKATGTDMSFENYLISSISKLKFAFLSLQCPLKKDSPSNAVNATECYRQGLLSLCETMQRGTENFGWFRHVGRWTGDMWPWQLGNGWCFLL